MIRDLIRRVSTLEKHFAFFFVLQYLEILIFQMAILTVTVTGIISEFKTTFTVIFYSLMMP